MRAGESRASARTKAQRANVDRQRVIGFARRQARAANTPPKESGPAWWTCPPDQFYAKAKQRQATITATAVPVYAWRDL